MTKKKEVKEISGRKTKYDPNTFPLLAEGYARDGLADYQISKNLGVSIDSFYKYKKRYPEFAEALKKGRKPVNIEVENALLKKAIGYEYEKTKTVKKIVDGKQTVEVHKETVVVSPSEAAIIFWLKNRLPKKWRDKQKEEEEEGKGFTTIQVVEATPELVKQLTGD